MIFDPSMITKKSYKSRGKQSRKIEEERLRIQKEIQEELSGLNNTEQQQKLKQRFQCRPNPDSYNDRREFITIKSGMLTNREPKIINRCRFNPSVEIDINHITGFCCNQHFTLCPHYRKYCDSQKDLNKTYRY